MLSELRTQFNVIKTLAIHNLQGQMKTYNYGFAWILLEPLIYIGAFRMARQAMGSSTPAAGMTPLMFYLLGILPLYSSFDGIKAFALVANPSNLLSFPRVTPVDLAVSAGVASFSIYFLLFWTVAIPVSIYEQVWPPQNIVLIIYALIVGWIFGMATGFALSGVYRVFPPIKQFVGYIVFGLRMLSGFFFCIVMVPVAYWPYLTWNPLLHVTEMVRDGWFESYTSPIASPMFVLECTIGMLLLGLSVERYMRRVPYA
jgi:capsular polysaccharide transport system permease protein